MSSTTEPLWTVEETSEYLNIPVETLYGWRKKRNQQKKVGPPSMRIGKHIRYDPMDVRVWLDQLKSGLLEAAF